LGRVQVLLFSYHFGIKEVSLLIRFTTTGERHNVGTEREESGGVEKIAVKIKGFLSGYEGLDLPDM